MKTADKLFKKTVGFDLETLRFAVENLLKKSPNLYSEQIHPERDHISNLVVWDYLYMDCLPYSVCPPIPKIEVTHPNLSYKQAEEIILNFYVDCV